MKSANTWQHRPSLREETGAWCSTISSSAGSSAPSSSSSMARRGPTRPLPRSGTECRCKRCTVHKHRNLLAHAPERLHEEITADYNDMIYATTPEEIAARRKALIRKWQLKHRAVADSLEEAGERLLPPYQRCRTTSKKG